MFRLRLALLGVALFLTSCSQTEWAVRWADTYIAWKLNDQFSFKGEAKQAVKRESRAVVLKVRETKFPEASQFFYQLAKDAAGWSPSEEKANAEIFARKIGDVEAFAQFLVEIAKPALLRLAPLVQANNWTGFKANFEKANRKLLEASGCESKFREQVSDWLGSLSREQKTTIANYCQARGKSQDVRVSNRRQLLVLVDEWAGGKSGFSNEKFFSAAEKFLNEFRDLQQPESRLRNSQIKELMAATLARIYALSTASQRESLISKLEVRGSVFTRMTL